MALLTTAQHEAIRKAIDVSLDATALPSAVIALDLYAGAAEREVLARDPDAESRTGDALAAVTTAAVLLCAARLVPAVPRVASLSSTGEGITQKLSDPDKLAADLRARGEAELAAVLADVSSTAVRPTLFRLAPGRRGR